LIIPSVSSSAHNCDPCRGSFAAAADSHVRRPVAQFAAAARGAQQPGQLYSGTVEVTGIPVTGRTRTASRLGHLRDRGASAGAEVEPDRVVHLAPRSSVQGGDAADHVQGGAGAVDGDQQATAVPGRDPRDRLGQHLDVIARGVRPGAARPQQQRQ